MLQQPTSEKLEAMRLHGMAQALRELAGNEAARELSFEDRLALLVDRQFTWRQNEALQARLRRAKFRPTPAWRTSIIARRGAGQNAAVIAHRGIGLGGTARRGCW